VSNHTRSAADSPAVGLGRSSLWNLQPQPSCRQYTDIPAQTAIY